MLTIEQIHSIHNLQAERWSLRRITRQLQMGHAHGEEVLAVSRANAGEPSAR